MAYFVNEIFWSPQGEGMRAGEMSVFIRFTGCNMRCAVEPGPKSPGGFDCDTEFESGRKMEAKEIIDEAKAACGLSDDYLAEHGAWVVLTGGEPGLQVDRALVDSLRLAGFRSAIETNGSIDLSGLGLDWITVSPKVAEHAIRQREADEIKYVRGYGQAIPKPSCRATYRLLSPAFNGLTIDHRALEWCLSLIKEDPRWRLSVQNHKRWLVR
jgi:organic radical activating enzyme